MQPLTIVAVAIVVALIGLGARWLFQERSPDEIRAARERLRKIRGK